MRISYSGLEAFISCPAKYKYQYLDRIKTPKSKEAVFGTLIHDCLKSFHNPSLLAPLSEDNLLKHFTDKWNSGLYQDEREEAFAFHQGIEILKNYYAHNQNLGSQIIDLEASFLIPFKTDSETHQITGRIDRIDKLPNGTFEIIDYKTAKKMPPQEMVDNNLQLSIYYLGLLHRWPTIQKQVQLSLYFVRHGEKLSTIRTDQQLQNDKEKISDLIAQIQQSKFEPKSNPLCDWCQYQPYCPLFRHKFVDKEDSPDEEKIKEIIKEYFEIKNRQSVDTKKIAELKKMINQYCDEHQLDRLFIDEGYITRQLQQRFAYDKEEIKNFLEPLGKWEEVLTVDNAKLKKVIASLPPHLQKEIEESKKVSSEFKVLNISQNSRT